MERLVAPAALAGPLGSVAVQEFKESAIAGLALPELLPQARRVRLEVAHLMVVRLSLIHISEPTRPY